MENIHCCGGVPEEKDKITDIEDFRKRVSDAIEKIRPALQMDGGDLKLVGVSENGDVQVALYGACSMCPFSQMTLKMNVERALKEVVPEVKSVEAV